MSVTASAANPPASIPDVDALRDCWHPVADADALASEPLRVTAAGRAGGALARLRRRAPCAQRRMHSSWDGALAGPGDRRSVDVPLPRLALRGRRQMQGDPAACRPDTGPRQGASCFLPRASRATGSCGWRSASRAGHCPRFPSSSLPRSGNVVRCGPYSWQLRRLPPGRELHRLRTLPVGAPGAARRSGPSGRPASQR